MELFSFLDAGYCLKYIFSPGIDRAVLEITAHRRPLARLVVLLITDGHSREKFEEIELAAVRLHATAADIYVVTMSKQPMTAELKEYAGSDGHVFINGREKVEQF
jgi:hypothetical protein